MIGAWASEWHSKKLTFDKGQPDLIAIYSDDQGVCNVVFSEGIKEPQHLSKDTQDCDPKSNSNIKENVIRLTDEAPLVGFHGMSDPNGLVSLGLILLDNLDPVCQQPHDNANFSMYEGMNIFDQSNAAEGAITQNEKDRAKALEAILKYDSMIKARESK